MNWNGHTKNNVLGNLAACKESIAVTKKRGLSSDEASWLLEKIDCERSEAAVIGFIVSLNQWCDALSDTEREGWLVWAMINYPIEVLQWMGYRQGWTMMPAAVSKRRDEVVRLARKGGLPSVYLLPGNPRDKDKAGPIILETGLEAVGIQLKTTTYIKWEDEWYKVYYPKLPSQSAVSRAIRLYLLGVLIGRQITTTKDLFMYELRGIRDWMSYNGDIVNGIAEHAGATLFYLLTEYGVVE